MDAAFHTGDHPAGYDLHSIGFATYESNFSDDETLSLVVCSSQRNGHADRALYTLTPPEGDLPNRATVYFTAPEGAHLEPDTNYHVAFQTTGDARADLGIRTTDSGAETVGDGESGWTIENGFRGYGDMATLCFLIDVKGSRAPARLTGLEITSSPGRPTAGGKVYGAGDVIEFPATFDKTFTVTGDPQYVFALGGGSPAQYERSAAHVRTDLNDVLGEYTMVFACTVQSGDTDDHQPRRRREQGGLHLPGARERHGRRRDRHLRRSV